MFSCFLSLLETINKLLKKLLELNNAWLIENTGYPNRLVYCVVAKIIDQTKYPYFHFWRSCGYQIWTTGPQIGEETREYSFLGSGDIITQHSDHVTLINTYIFFIFDKTLVNKSEIFKNWPIFKKKYKWTLFFWYCEILKRESYSLFSFGVYRNYWKSKATETRNKNNT